jgi:leucyl aminopeptidase (aminopeptidase T)
VATDLRTVSFDPDLVEGARNAVRVCLAVQPGESVAVVTDRQTLGIGAALVAQLDDIHAPWEACVLEDHGTRPMATLPEPVERALRGASVSIFAGRAYPGELTMRIALTRIVGERRIRHAHMVGIDHRIMTEGMRADFRQVDALTNWVFERASKAREISCRTPAGTDLRAIFDPSLKWIPTPGLIDSSKWGNLPGGETFTSPARVDGIFVVDGVLGDWLAPKHGDMREMPLKITIEESRIVDLVSKNRDALEDFRTYVSTDENSNRVGEFALGTNLAVKNLIGNMLQDEKIPGVHIAFGHPYSEHTGATWTSRSHIDVVGRDFDVWFDGRQVMRSGRYLTENGSF